MVRKRAPGGGRKPIGSTAAQPLTIRMDDDLRSQLEAAAVKRAKRKQKWNISQEILLRLRWSLGKERDERRNRALTAICDLISNMAKRELLTDLPEQQSWHRDPFTFRAFKVAVAELLEGLEHELELSGEMHPPPALAAIFEAFGSLDPEQLGGYAADKVLIALRHARSATRAETMKFFLPKMPTARGDWIYDQGLTTDEVAQQLVFWPGIRRALGIEELPDDY